MASSSSPQSEGGASRPRGRPGLTPETREQALKAAGDLLAERGLQGMQARTIAARAGLSVGSIYKLFGDIDDLIRELNLETYRSLAVHHVSALESSGLGRDAVIDRLMVLAGAYIEFVITRNARWRALLSFNRRQAGGAPRAYTETENDLFGIVESVLEPAPGFSDPAYRAKAARALWASVHGIVTVLLPNAASDEPVAETLDQIGMIVGAVIRDAGMRE